MNINDFLENTQVQKSIARAKELKSKKFSNVTDNEGNQYVNLVQEGGGVLGIALVGFTFILEQAGIRFWRLAGTSAGAINTMLLASIGIKNEPKSEIILTEFAQLDLLKFADGNKIVPAILKKYIVNPKVIKNMLITYLGLWILMFLNLILLAIHPTKWYAIFTLSILAILIFLGVFVWWLIRRFKKNNWGLCKGDVFYEWIKTILDKHGIHNVTDLKSNAYKSLNDLDLNVSVPQNFDGADVTVITCDITKAVKVEFPLKMDAYNLSNSSTHPASFVRASMSIPLFFNPFQFNNKGSYFVDGGVISNFPISIFHKPEIRSPRIPIVGVLLDEGYGSEPNISKGITTFLMRIFKSVMNHSDKEFLVKNEFYERFCIHKINVENHNWLNFSMIDIEKIDLFVKGVHAGITFLEKFDWDEYRTSREELYDKYMKAFDK